MLTTIPELLRTRPAVAALNVITLEFAEGIVTGAERVALPVALSISHNAVRFHGGLAPLAAACREIAERASVPVALHLDHCESADLVLESADLGFGSAMFDASTRPFAENLAETARVTAEAHARGLWVEAELGEIGGKDGAHAPGVRTDPDDAARFVAETGVDALAVAVGTSHAMRRRVARPDTDLIARLAAAVPVPLVLHGSSGVPDDGIRACVAAGIRKVNVGTQVSGAYRRALAEGLGWCRGADPRPALADARSAVADTAARILAVIATSPDRLERTP